MKRQLTWLLALCLCPLVQAAGKSTPDPAVAEPAGLHAEPVERPALRSRDRLQLQRLQQAYPGQFRSLVTAHDETGALYLPANRDKARGWIILLPGSNETADSAFNIDLLRRTLPDSGWHTLSLQVPQENFSGLRISPSPDSSVNSQPAGPDDSTSVDSTRTDSSPDEKVTPGNPAKPATAEATNPASLEQRIHAVLDAVMELTRKEDPEENHLILLGQHEGAWHLLQWLNQQPAIRADALILLHPRHPDSDSAELASLAGASNIPVTDYFSSHRQPEVQAARQRLNASKRNPGSNYLQTGLREPASALQQSELVRRMKGHLNKFDAKN